MVLINRDLILPVITSWEDWGSRFTDVETWAPAVREIGRRAGLPVATIEAGYPGTNAVFIVNADTDQAYIVKISCPYYRDDFTLERELHPLLAHYPEIPAPVLLGHGELRGEMAWPYLILSFISGAAIRDVRSAIPHTNLMSIAHDLGRRVSVLHNIPRPVLAPLAPFLGHWSNTTARLAATCDILSCKAVLPSALIEQIPDYVTPTLANPTDLVLVNGDLTEDHLLLQEHSGQWELSGLIDFADALIAPRDYEWVALWFGALDREPACLRAFMAGYDADIILDAAFRHRAMGFTFLHEFGGLIIGMALNQLGNPHIESLLHLEALLWPL